MSENLSLKEMLLRVMDDTDEIKAQMLTHNATTTAHLKAIDAHLAQLNSKVATHTTEIGDLAAFRNKALMVWGAIVFVATSVLNYLISHLPRI